MRGVYHRAGQRPDPVAYCALRAYGDKLGHFQLALSRSTENLAMNVALHRSERPPGFMTVLSTLPGVRPMSQSSLSLSEKRRSSLYCFEVKVSPTLPFV